MKKTIIILSLIILSFSAFAQKTSSSRSKPVAVDTTVAKPVKTTLSVELKPEDWEVVLQIINQSNAPHPQVSAVQQVLQQQLLPQFQQLQAQVQQQKQSQDTIKKK